MSDFRSQMVTYSGPGCLAGITAFDWLALLAENSFRVSPKYLLKAGYITASSPFTSAFGLLENLLHGRRFAGTEVTAPLFILGCWRSGTTHLHTMLCADERFAAPSLFQTMYPHTFLTAEPWLKPLLGLFSPKTRFMDNMVMGLDEPHEDEMALCIASRKSNMLSWVFPRNADLYDRHLNFLTASHGDISAWQTSLEWYLRKLTYKFRKPLILKSPNHTARIRLILEKFPDAKFLHIHRHPHEVYSSMCHMASKVMPVWGLQHFDPTRIPEMVIETYARLYEPFFEQVPTIPAGQFHEVSFEEVSQSPIETMQRAYSALDLPDFEQARPRMQAYVDSVANYKKNRHTDIPNETKQRLRDRWQQSFTRWGYNAD